MMHYCSTVHTKNNTWLDTMYSIHLTEWLHILEHSPRSTIDPAQIELDNRSCWVCRSTRTHSHFDKALLSLSKGSMRTDSWINCTGSITIFTRQLPIQLHILSQHLLSCKIFPNAVPPPACRSAMASQGQLTERAGLTMLKTKPTYDTPQICLHHQIKSSVTIQLV